MVFLHGGPIERYTQFQGCKVEKIPYKNNEIEAVRPKRTTVILFEDSIAHVQFVTVLAVDTEEAEEEDEGAEKTTDIRKS